ncbi:hypothetical protein KIW84_054821 [Lathyrus oleraceus]|uniref:Uncharacterized protein n=1 Tax=Pisum sativum TaxID=3888 RepID=A0A9D4WZ08_PEA|nr:hypothetical protein KIW84_054821 [Pisum sativum]
MLILSIGIGSCVGLQLHSEDGWFQKLKEEYVGYADELRDIIIDKGALSSLKKLELLLLRGLKNIPTGIKHLEKLEVLHIQSMQLESVQPLSIEDVPHSAAACFFSLLEVCRHNRTTVLCTAVAEHENHHILSPSASVRVAVIAPAVTSESDHSDRSNADTLKSTDTGDSGQPKNTTFRGSKSEFHPALAVSNIRNHIPIILGMEKDQYDGDHPSQM